MLKLLILAPFVLGASLVAQNCVERNLGVPMGTGDDVMLGIQPIGFAFPFAGTSYSNVHVCTNGYFHLSNGGVPPPAVGDGTSTATELVSGPPRVCALWTDLNIIVANGANVYINSTAAKCTITWNRAVTFGSPGPLFDVQAQLFPSGEIKFFYDANVTNNSTSSTLYAQGLTGVSAGQGALLPSVSDLIAGGATTDNTLYEDWLTATTFDLANNCLHLIPTSPGWIYAPLGAPTNCATSTNYGTGCIDQADTYYEYLATGAFDLAGSTVTMLRQPGGYVVFGAIPGTFVPPSPGATIVANGDDTEQVVTLSAPMPVAGGTTTSLNVCSNGRIALSATSNGAVFTPAIATFLAFPATAIAADWHDYNPTITNSGKILFEQVGGIAYVTWNGVFSYGTTSPNTFQYQFNLATGDCTIVYGTFTLAGNDHLVGYSVGGPSSNPLVLDLSVALANPVSVFDTAVIGLRLATTGFPTPGSTLTYGISEVPNVLPLAFVFFGDTQINPGIDLSFIGMPGCAAYTNANLVSVTVPVAAGVGSLPLPIPNSVGLVGIALATQAVAFSLSTPANLVSSNGNLATIGF